MKKLLIILICAVSFLLITACGQKEEVIEEVVEEADWWSDADIVSKNVIDNDGLKTTILVTVDGNGAYFYRDEAEQILFDSVAFPIEIENAREHFVQISFVDINGNGESDVRVTFDYDDGKTYLPWVWDKDERYVFQWDDAVFTNSQINAQYTFDYGVYIGYKHEAKTHKLACGSSQWEYDDDASILEVTNEEWKVYNPGEDEPFNGGTIKFENEIDTIYKDNDGSVFETGYLLIYLGLER